MERHARCGAAVPEFVGEPTRAVSVLIARADRNRKQRISGTRLRGQQESGSALCRCLLAPTRAIQAGQKIAVLRDDKGICSVAGCTSIMFGTPHRNRELIDGVCHHCAAARVILSGVHQRSWQRSSCVQACDVGSTATLRCWWGGLSGSRRPLADQNGIEKPRKHPVLGLPHLLRHLSKMAPNLICCCG